MPENVMLRRLHPHCGRQLSKRLRSNKLAERGSANIMFDDVSNLAVREVQPESLANEKGALAGPFLLFQVEVGNSVKD